MLNMMNKDGDVTQITKNVEQYKNLDNMRILQIIQEKENQKNLYSEQVRNSISDKPNLLIAIALVAIVFMVVPLLPIVGGILLGHWLSKQSNKRG